MKTKIKSAKVMARVEEIAPNSKQPRTFFAAAELERLGKSLRAGQRTPVIVAPLKDGRRPKVKWMLVDGERRWRAARAAGIETLWIAEEDPMEPEGAAMHEASLVSNFCREGHTWAEKIAAVARLRQAGKSAMEIAAMVGKGDHWVYQCEALAKLHPKLLAKMDPPTPPKERLPAQASLLLTKFDHAKQLRLYEQHKNRSAADFYHQVRLAGGADRATRDPSKDGDWLLGKLSNAKKQIFEAGDMPRAMLRNVSPDKINRCWPALDEIDKLLSELRGRLSIEGRKVEGNSQPEDDE